MHDRLRPRLALNPYHVLCVTMAARVVRPRGPIINDRFVAWLQRVGGQSRSAETNVFGILAIRAGKASDRRPPKPEVAAKSAATGSRRRFIHRDGCHPPEVGFEAGPYPRHLARYVPVQSQVESGPDVWQRDIDKYPEFRGWGTWIRTKAARSRAGSSTAKLSPKRGAGARQYHAPNTPATSTDGCQLGLQRVGPRRRYDMVIQDVARAYRPTVISRIVLRLRPDDRAIQRHAGVNPAR